MYDPKIYNSRGNQSLLTMENIEFNIKHNSIFMSYLLAAVSFELLLISIGIPNKLMPNFIMCIVFSYAYIKPVPLWLIWIGVFTAESFFSTTPILMTIMILSLYFLIIFTISKQGLLSVNMHMISFLLITLVVYSVKILWLYANDFRPDVTFTIIKLLVTVILFPLFYISTTKLVKLYS